MYLLSVDHLTEKNASWRKKTGTGNKKQRLGIFVNTDFRDSFVLLRFLLFGGV